MLGGPEWALKFQVPILRYTKAILSGHLMNVYDIIEDSSTLRVLRKLKEYNAPHYSKLYQEAEKIWNGANGMMTSSVMEYVRGPFFNTVNAISKEMGWSVLNKDCNIDFIEEVARFQESDTSETWLPLACSTPCLCVNSRTNFSAGKRCKSNFDGSSADRICKSDVNLFDLFRTIACDGKILVLRQKNNCSISLIPSISSGDSVKYIFEIGGMFESKGSYSFFYFTNGMICDIFNGMLRATDSQYRLNFASGYLSIIQAAIACRFRVPYNFVSNFIESRRERSYNGMTVDHCDIDSGNNSMWNMRLATMDAQNNNKNGDYFVFSNLKDMEENDSSLIEQAFRDAIIHAQIYRLWCPSGSNVSLATGEYKKLIEVGRGHDSVWYFDTVSEDTILLKSKDPYEHCRGSATDEIQFLSMRVYTSRGLCDVSDCAAQQRYTDLTIGRIKYSISRSLAFSNALHHGHQEVDVVKMGGFKYAKVKNQEGNLHVHHINGKPRHNFSKNLAIITQSENNNYAQQAVRDRNQKTGMMGFSLAFNNTGDFYWSHTRQTSTTCVRSFPEAALLRKEGNSSCDTQYSVLLSELFSKERLSAPTEMQKYRFEICDIRGVQKKDWTLGQLYAELNRRNLNVAMWQLEKFVQRTTANANSRSMHKRGAVQVKYYNTGGKRMNTMTLFPKST